LSHNFNPCHQILTQKEILSPTTGPVAPSPWLGPQGSALMSTENKSQSLPAQILCMLCWLGRGRRLRGKQHSNTFSKLYLKNKSQSYRVGRVFIKTLI
jgi:hypothetical protein